MDGRAEAPTSCVLSAGQAPAPQGRSTSTTWESFSTNWNGDVKSTFFFGQEASRGQNAPGENGGHTCPEERHQGGAPMSGRRRRRQGTKRLMAM